ncbi:MAG: MBOAT family protein [Oscillospiraceae bacterium]|nr:MBOAT family protein [Oscillospiraceae bacterium]
MVFSTLVFLFIFMPAVLIMYNLSSNRTYKNVILVISSLIFYAWGEPLCICLLMISALSDYTIGRIMDKHSGQWQAKLGLIMSLVIDLGILIIFKYSGFFAGNIGRLLGIEIAFKGLPLPLGISFYTFQTLSYTIDVYRGEVKVQKSFLKYLVYLSMFPQLVAGPIVRYIDIENQIDTRVVTIEKFSAGISRFMIGLFKKVVLANGAGSVASLILDGNLSDLSSATAWLGMFMYSFQIYFDFSGYSDMAIGLGKMFGFDFHENFNYPYISKNVTEFWRRWHISLGTFFRDYVYIPLGGNRRHQMLNIFIVWFLTGFWHGASWNFILWGLYYGVLLIIEKKCFNGALMRMPAVLGTVYNAVITLIGWSIFYFTDMGRLVGFFRAGFGMNGLFDYRALSIAASNIWFIAVLLFASTPIPKKIFTAIDKRNPDVSAALSHMGIICIFILCFILLIGQTYNPFLYFRF